MRYRSKWYINEGPSPLIFGIGIHGQFLFVDRKNEIVIAKMSSQASALAPERKMMVMKTAATLQDYLSG